MQKIKTHTVSGSAPLQVKGSALPHQFRLRRLSKSVWNSCEPPCFPAAAYHNRLLAHRQEGARLCSYHPFPLAVPIPPPSALRGGDSSPAILETQGEPSHPPGRIDLRDLIRGPAGIGGRKNHRTMSRPLPPVPVRLTRSPAASRQSDQCLTNLPNKRIRLHNRRRGGASYSSTA